MGWKNFVEAEEDELVRIRTYPPFELEAKIAILMDEAQSYEVCLEIGAIIDCFFNVYMFANSKELGDRQLLNLLRLQSKLLSNCQQGVDLHTCLNIFTQALKHEESIEEDATEVDEESSMAVIDYMLSTFFQHYQLYTNLFTHSQLEIAEEREVFVEVVPNETGSYLAPLEEGVSEEWYNLYINPTTEVQEETVNEEETPISENTQVVTEEDPGETDSEKNAESLLSTIDPEQLKKVVKEAAEKKLEQVKLELHSKIMEKEAMLLKNIEKLKL